MSVSLIIGGLSNTPRRLPLMYLPGELIGLEIFEICTGLVNCKFKHLERVCCKGAMCMDECYFPLL